jgi:tRNA pseudouridine38-40 synthase
MPPSAAPQAAASAPVHQVRDQRGDEHGLARARQAGDAEPDHRLEERLGHGRDRGVDPARHAVGDVNWHLKPDPVAVLAAARVPDDWHARFSAIERRYLYRLVARRAPMTLEHGLVWRVAHPLALAPMREAAAHLLGRMTSRPSGRSCARRRVR